MAGTDYEGFERWLDSFLNFEKLPQKGMFWLDTMEFLCGRLGNPERAVRCVHVAGSKGKGSVSAMVAHILQAAGQPCGLYASPHIADFRERITQCGAFLPGAVYEAAARELRSTVTQIPAGQLPGGRQITWFELVTLYAFLCFRRAGLPCAVYEVGLGGRLDATNVVLPEVCCLCPIELEHTEFLGSTVGAVAQEKAGIIKAGVPVFAAQQPPEARRVFEAAAARSRAPIVFADEACTALQYEYTARRTMLVEFSVPQYFARPLRTELRLLGAVQAQNAVLAALAARQFAPGITEGQVEAGLAAARLPARFELCEAPAAFPQIPQLILDGAHTPRSIAFTVQTYRALFPQKPVLLFACAKDKDIADIAPLFRDAVADVFLTRPGAAKSADLDALAAAFSGAGIAFRLDDDYRLSIRAALERAEQARLPLLVTGSFYLVAEVKQFLCF